MKYFYLVPLIGFLFSCSNPGQEKKTPNILMIAIDDLNDWTGFMGGHPDVKTPNLDRLAEKGVVFTNAHCQAPICGPSRASIMTGLYPTTSGIYLQISDPDIRKSNQQTQEAIFLPDYFEQNGYKTLGVGKLFHNGDKAGVFEEYGSAFEMFGPKPEKRFNYDPAWFNKPGGTQTDWGAFPEYDSLMPDYKSASWAINQLQKAHEKPFFLAVGFVRPHVPWYVPQKWLDLYHPDSLEMPPYLPTDFSDIPEMGKRVADVPMMPTTEWAIETGQWKEMVRAYLACVTFVDHQAGRVLDALEKSEYADNTLVVLWSDHGYHVGEKNRFAKQALWRASTNSLLLFAGPEIKPAKTNAPAGLIDIYPTLLELAELPANQANQGHSLVPLLNNPSREWENFAFTAYGLGNYSLFDNRYHFIQYEDGSEELYDLQYDPEEWENLAKKEQMKELLINFRNRLPEKHAPMSPGSKYNINEYFTRLSEQN